MARPLLARGLARWVRTAWKRSSASIGPRQPQRGSRHIERVSKSLRFGFANHRPLACGGGVMSHLLRPYGGPNRCLLALYAGSGLHAQRGIVVLHLLHVRHEVGRIYEPLGGIAPCNDQLGVLCPSGQQIFDFLRL